MGIIKIEWGFREDIRNILFFLFLLQVNYYKFHKNLRYDASKFRLLRFSVIYIVIALCVGFGLGPLIFAKTSDVFMYVGLLTLAAFIPYFIFLACFLIFYFLQIIYLAVRSLVYTIDIYRKLKAAD